MLFRSNVPKKWKRHKLQPAKDGCNSDPSLLTEPSQSRGLPMVIHPADRCQANGLSANEERHVSPNSFRAHNGGNFEIVDPLSQQLKL